MEAGANGTLGLNVSQIVTSEYPRLNVHAIILNLQMEVAIVEDRVKGLFMTFNFRFQCLEVLYKTKFKKQGKRYIFNHYFLHRFLTFFSNFISWFYLLFIIASH